MLKLETTKKAILQNYKKVIAIPYSKAQRLLKYRDPQYFTSTKTHKWRADIYIINNVAIVTGRALFGNIRPGRKMIDNYERRAEMIAQTVSEYETRREMVNALLNEFIMEV